MSQPSARAVVCRHCGKINKHDGPECLRCGADLAAPAPAPASTESGVHRVRPSRSQLVTRQAADGSLEMVRLAPEEVTEESVEIAGAAAEPEPEAPDGDDGIAPSKRQRLILFAAVGVAAVVVILLAWPSGRRQDTAAGGAVSAPSAPAAPGDGPRAPKLVPVAAPEPEPKPTAAPAAPAKPEPEPEPEPEAQAEQGDRAADPKAGPTGGDTPTTGEEGDGTAKEAEDKADDKAEEDGEEEEEASEDGVEDDEEDDEEEKAEAEDKPEDGEEEGTDEAAPQESDEE